MKMFLVVLFFFVGLPIFSQTKPFKLALKKAYNFEKTENYVSAKKVFEVIKNDKQVTISEKLFIKNYLLFYDYLLSDQNDIKNIDLAIKDILRIEKRTYYESELLINLTSSKYHFLANTAGWSASLTAAEAGYKLKDFNYAKLETRTDYLYDLGYLYDKAGNSFEGINFYKKSLALYIKEYGEINTEVALNYNNLAYAYTNVYNQKNIIAYYEKAARIWEIVYKNLIDDHDYLVTVCHNLIYQYINYGNLEKAVQKLNKLNNYVLKKYQTNESKKESTYSLSFLDYSLSNIRLNLALNNKNKALKFLENFEENHFLPYKKEIHYTYLMQCYSEIADYLIDNKDCETALNLLEKALSIANKYEQKQYLVTLNAQIATVYKCQNKKDLAIKFFEIAQKNNTKTYFNSSKYTLEFLKAEVYFEKNQGKIALSSIKTNIEQLLFDYSKKKKSIEKVNFSDVKELVSTEFINLFFKSGKIYFQNYKKFKIINDLQIADNMLRPILRTGFKLI
jgi:tetratricopeptide (TPR) repeat protein